MPDSSRRDFLTGRAAVRALGDVRDKLAPPLPPPEADSERSYLVSVSRDAMACTFEVALNAGQYPGGTDAALAALDLVDRLEDQLTVFREHSEISRLNRRAASGPVVVEQGLFELLVQAKRLFEETDGALDITNGPLTKVWGFYRREGRMPTQDEIDEALACVGSQWLELDESACSVRFLRPGMEINLGAIGKGYALDRAAEHLVSHGIEDFLIHGGSSSVLARGARERSGFRVGSGEVQSPKSKAQSQTEPETDDNSQIPNPQSQIAATPQSAIRNPQSNGWLVALAHPLKPEQRLAEVTLVNQALGTSGSGSQFFHHQGKRYGHIIDPRSGWPADRVLSATVIARSAALSDALSTAFYVGGLELAEAYCRSHPEIAALLITSALQGARIELHPVNLAADQWRTLAA